jgi:hypothetical protein
MQDPLTKEQRDYFFAELRKEIEDRYDRTLPRLDAETFPVAADTGSFLLAKCVLMRSADDLLFGPDGRELLNYLREAKI